MQKKRRHHYVWRYYLSAWERDGVITCRRGDGSVFPTTTKNVAVRTDYYRLRKMTEDDLAFVERVCISNAPTAVQPVLRGWIPTFTAVFEFREQLREAGFDVRRGASHDAFDTVINNLEEELHASIERDAIPHMRALRSKDMSFLQDMDQAAGFLHYLAVQYTRTEKRRQATRDAFETTTVEVPVNLENAWGLMSHVLATNLAYGLFTRRNETKVELLGAPDGSKFITTDQPVVNLHAIGSSASTEVDELTLYYPVSPELALLWDIDAERGASQTRTASATEVQTYNEAVFGNAHEQVYATNRAVLEGLQN